METMCDNSWKTLASTEVEIDPEQFWVACSIWNRNPHTVNRRISSVIPLVSLELCNDVCPNQFIKCIQSLDITSIDTVEKVMQLLNDKNILSDEKHYDKGQIFVKKLLPRNSDRFKQSHEVAIFDRTQGAAFFVGISVEVGSLIPSFPYRLNFKLNCISLQVQDIQSIEEPSCVWLRSQFFPRFTKWTQTASSHEKVCGGLGTAGTSLTLVSLLKYNDVYQQLKKKYGREMVKIWPECTDPAKFIYEDVAIATYLLLLWEGEGQVSFVDLGCGNGLLVHILNSEGHCGIGFDVRSRKIWDLYPATTKLEIRAITPSDSALFPDADWLIGNHSDELTPWIPVIAARSSQKCNFFLLPCCAYNFDGKKYRRQDSSLSQYSEYLEYIRTLSEGCGFKTQVDRLRIPSTKRVCLVGQGRIYNDDEWERVNSNITHLIERGCGLSAESEQRPEEWVLDFKPRETKERVRNCTQLQRSLVEDIVLLTTNHLLAKRRLLPSRREKSQMWNAGGISTISELVPLIGAEKLKELKKECGGLQTLLKNNHQVFLVVGGKVQLRQPVVLEDVKASGSARTQTKPCWFYNNHPDGCLLKDENCSFKH